MTRHGKLLTTIVILTVALLAGCGPSGPVGVPAPPRDVKAAPIAGGINLTWIDQSSDEDGFIVLRKAASSDGPPVEEIGRVASDELSYADFAVAEDGSYVYAVQSFNVVGPSDPVIQSPDAPVTPLPGVPVNVTFDGDGTVVIAGGAVSKSCSDDCQVAFAAGTDITFNAHSAEGAVFAGWAGACSGAGECALTVDEPLEVEARFRRHVLQLSLAGDSPVRLKMIPPDDFGTRQCELSLGDECALAYGYEGYLEVSITAEKLDPNGTFNGFDGPCIDTGPLYCLVNVSGATPVAIKSVHPPVAFADSYSTAEDVPLEVAAPGVLANDEDTPDDTLSAVLESAPSNGQLDLRADGSFTYTPNQDYNGPDSFTYRARDAYGSESEPATVSLNVTAVNDPPVFELSATSIDAGPANGTPRSVADFATGIGPGGGSDEAGQTVTFTVTKVSGDLAPMAVEPHISQIGTLAYQPATSSFGSATYEVKASDSAGGTSAAQQFTINVESYTLSLVTVGEGTISATPPSANGEYGWGTGVLLSANPASGYMFRRWQGEGCSGNTPCLVNMIQDREVTATFEPYVSVTFGAPRPTVTVSSSPTGISCSTRFLGPTACTFPFPLSTSLTLTLDISTGLSFGGVQCKQNEPTTQCTFEVTGPVTVTVSNPPATP